jgi:hypothetical protein
LKATGFKPSPLNINPGFKMCIFSTSSTCATTPRRRGQLAAVLPVEVLQHGWGPCIYGLWFMVYGLWFMVYGLWFMVYGLWFMVYGLWFMVYGLL